MPCCAILTTEEYRCNMGSWYELAQETGMPMVNRKVDVSPRNRCFLYVRNPGRPWLSHPPFWRKNISCSRVRNIHSSPLIQGLDMPA